jgi:fumarate hydratase subunit beta
MVESEPRRFTTPLSLPDCRSVRAGDRLLLSGTIYSARDAAHRRMVEDLAKGRALPFEPEGQVIYYMGPSPPRPGRVIGAAGPTTSYRMDAYAPTLYAAGVRATIGKGTRSQAVRDAIVQHGALYLAAIGGAGALLSGCIREAEVIAFPELGPEAVRRLVVTDFPVVVVNDVFGSDLYEMARQGHAAASGGE